MLKTKTITTAKATVLVVELPDGAINPVVSMGYITARVRNHSYGIPTHDIWDYKKNEEYLAKYDPSKEYDDWVKKLDVEGNWQLLGRIPDITEEQASKAIPTMPIQKGETKRYITAKEGLLSLLQANDVYFENPIKFFNNKEIESNGSLMDWHNAQSKVWDRERCYLFIKVD